jgi:hypothetical protein
MSSLENIYPLQLGLSPKELPLPNSGTGTVSVVVTSVVLLGLVNFEVGKCFLFPRLHSLISVHLSDLLIDPKD